MMADIDWELLLADPVVIRLALKLEPDQCILPHLLRIGVGVLAG